MMYILHLFLLSNVYSSYHIYTLSLHDALPIFMKWVKGRSILIIVMHFQSLPKIHAQEAIMAETQTAKQENRVFHPPSEFVQNAKDRKSTRLNSSHVKISYAVFCLKKKIK